jgi:hypothetical protein
VIELVRAAADLQTLSETEGWRFCFIGGLAVQQGGQLRNRRSARIGQALES